MIVVEKGCLKKAGTACTSESAAPVSDHILIFDFTRIINGFNKL